MVQAGLALAVGFGLQWTGEQVALVLAFSAAIVAVVTRQVSTPVAAPKLEIGSDVNAGTAVVVPK